MTEYPSHLVRRRRLTDGRTLTIRPVRPGDAAAERRFLEALSPETRRLRFLGRVTEPDAKLVQFLTQADYDRHMAFVAESPEGAIVGNARYVVNDDGRSCEFGVVVADDWRHTGVAQLLMDALIRAAQARRLETMEGLVMSENRGMLDFAGLLGFEAAPDPADASLTRVVKRL
ncbi:MAG TPA: GNAT family N-acetyltransferase [Burkholderiales bacterium]|nr:GNAT family N-acetyltransferase [Burkholderiales bacterium]